MVGPVPVTISAAGDGTAGSVVQYGIRIFSKISSDMRQRRWYVVWMAR